MLDFFRRHQRYFFAVITVVIVISFSFFGTYSTLSDNSFREQIAFKTIDGTDVTRHELDEFVTFLGTDAEDKLIYGGAWGPNFLNDGVVKKSFLETGLAAELIAAYPGDIRGDLETRLEKEKRFELYVHPQARFVGVEGAWNYFSPEMATYYKMLKSAHDPMSQEALQSRMALFLMERQFPAPILRQVLRYQEKQHNWITPDRNLDYLDLSLFGYHTVEDWFGPRFMRLIAEFIINTSIIAEQKGYQVTKADALADLMRNSETSFQQNARNPNLGVTNSREYFNEQLRRLGMDQNKAANLWRKVLLSRRMFQDLGGSVFVDPFTFEKLDAYALASAEGELYRLPKELRLNNYRSMQKFETYLDAVSKRTDDEKSKLTLPASFLAAAEVAKKYPELVQKRYLLEVAQIDKKSLEANVGVRESWDWETQDKGWEQLKKQFPEVGAMKASTRDERFAALDTLDEKARGRIDAFARAAIVEAHPEWLDKALDEAAPARMVVGLHEKGGNSAFIGLENGKTMMQLLDAAPLVNQESAALKPAEQEADDKLSLYSADNNTYYRITVIERAAQPDVLTFTEANEQGALDKLLDKQLEAHYVKIRDSNPKEFQAGDKSWKPLSDVRDLVADSYFEKLLKAIRSAYAASIAPKTAPDKMIGDYAATLRFLPYMSDMKLKFQKDPEKIAEWTREPKPAAANGNALTARENLADQWTLERSSYMTTRSQADQISDKEELFTLADGTWTKVNTPANGDLNFFFLKQKGNATDAKAITASVAQARRLLSGSAQQKLMSHLLLEIKDKHAISLDYMNQTAERELPESDYNEGF